MNDSQFKTIDRALRAITLCAAVLVSGGCGGGDDQAWGQAKLVFAGSGTETGVDVQGQDFGIERVRVVMQGNGSSVTGVLPGLEAELATRRGRYPGQGFGIVPQRVPTVEYREGRSSDPGYAVVDVDPVTGVARLPGLRYNDNLTPYNADATILEQRANVVERMLASALDREAIALAFEVQTARMQHDRGDAMAGRSEVLRAAQSGQLAPLVGSSGTVRDPGRFMPLALDLDGDGVISTVPDSASRRAINWDGSGFLKQVAWVSVSDALLFLDRNGDGLADHGRELFSEPLIVDAAKGAASLAWLDANGDGRITAADPAFAALRVWRDTISNGVVDSGEAVGLTALGISEIDYHAGRYTRNGVVGLVGNPALEAASEGYRIQAVTGGLQVDCSDGTGSLIVGLSSPNQLNLEVLCR